MPVSFETYERIALKHPERKLELVSGELREKPPMTTEHEDAASNLAWELSTQLSRHEYSVRQGSPNLAVPAGNYRIADVCVIPREFVRRRRREQPATFEVYSEPMPLVVEVWSPSTGTQDLETKPKEYRLRSDAEIWLLHPYERTLTTRRRQPNGRYVERRFRGGMVHRPTLPGVRIDLDSLFE